MAMTKEIRHNYIKREVICPGNNMMEVCAKSADFEQHAHKKLKMQTP